MKDESTQEEREYKDLLVISDTLNNAKIFDTIAEALGLKVNSDDEFFHDIEEDILKNFTRMNKEYNNERQ